MKTFYIDVKTIVWHRSEFKVEDNITLEDIVQSIKEEDIEDIAELNHSEYLYETVEDMTPDQNEGLATIEVLDENLKPIWTNELPKQV